MIVAVSGLRGAPSPVTFVGANSVNTTGGAAGTVTIPAHQVGDLLLMFGCCEQTVAPTIPAAGGTVPTWTSIVSSTSGHTFRLCSAVATATNHTSGSWTMGTTTGHLTVAVLRGQSLGAFIGGVATEYSNTSGSQSAAVTWPAPAVTMSDTSGNSQLLHFYWRNATLTWPAAPSGYTRQVTTNKGCLNTKNATTSDGSIVQTGDGTSQWWRTASVEVVAA